VDREVNPKDPVRRTASFPSRKWSRDALNREVLVFGISRTVPATERVELRKCASSTFHVQSDQIAPLSQGIALAAQRILGRDFSKFSQIRVGQKGRVSLLAGTTLAGESFSEFHFGAGEASVLRMIMATESASENSLLLIEEIENGLHPLATMRMVEYLIDLAKRKKIQTIFTTHSNEALVPLPSQAVWTSVDFRVVQGKPDILALRAITGDVEKQLVIYTEDGFSKSWMEVLLRNEPGVAADLVEVHAMAGDGSAVQMNRFHNSDPTRRIPSVCYIDGDSSQADDEKSLVFRLPGGRPESYVFDSVQEVLSDAVGVLAAALHTPYEDQQRVVKTISEVRLTNLDPHLLYSQLGFKLGLVPEQIVREGFLYVWRRYYGEEAKAVLAPILPRLPRERSDSTPLE